MTKFGAWTYSGDPSTSDKDAVRFLISDTDESDQQITDAEIEWLVSENGNRYRAASAACLALATAYARLATSKAEGDLRLDYSKRVDDLRALATQLRATGGRNLPIVYAGGISIADHEANASDPDRIGPVFTVGQDDFPIGRQAPDDFRSDESYQVFEFR